MISAMQKTRTESRTVVEPGCFHGVAREGPNLHYFNIKMWLTINYFSA